MYVYFDKMLNSSSIVVVVAILLLFSLRILFYIYLFCCLRRFLISFHSIGLCIVASRSYLLPFALLYSNTCCYSFVSFFTYHISSFFYFISLSLACWALSISGKKWWYSDIFSPFLSFVKNVHACCWWFFLLLLLLWEIHSVVSAFFSQKKHSTFIPSK